VFWCFCLQLAWVGNLLVKYVNRYKVLQYSTVICNVLFARFYNWIQQSRQYRVFELGNSIYQVQKPDSSIKFIDKLGKRSSCICTNLQEYCSPCSHAITACRYKAIDLLAEFVEVYKVEIYMLIYKVFSIAIFY
jgi:hypothetical protein